MSDLIKQDQNLPVKADNVAYGFEETKAEDIVIPRIKVINALSPERTAGEAAEGDVINSLTKEKVEEKRFIPLKQYYSNIRWDPDRNAEVRIRCRSFDGRIATDADGNHLACATCPLCKFDNTKKGKDAQPQCTSYLNFLGFFAGDPMPVVISFAKTNYNEGKKMLSIARSMRTSIWDYAYKVSGRKIAKDRNVWYIMVTQMAGPTTADERALAFELYKSYEKSAIKADYEDTTYTEADTLIDTETAAEI